MLVEHKVKKKKGTQMMLFKRKRSNTNNNVANQKNSLKGGININVEKDVNSLIGVLIGIKQSISDLKQDQLKNNEDTKLLKKAFGIYVENNGVEPHVKKIVKELLED